MMYSLECNPWFIKNKACGKSFGKYLDFNIFEVHFSQQVFFKQKILELLISLLILKCYLGLVLKTIVKILIKFRIKQSV